MAVVSAKAVRWGAVGLWRLFRRYYYWIVLAIIIIPTIITSIQVAVETNNPIHPLVQFGLHLGNADAILYEDVQILKTDPIQLIGVEKPTNGIWKNFVYYWAILKVAWKFLGLVWLISFPFFLLYKIIKQRQTSEPAKNFMSTIKYGLVYLLIFNLAMAVYYLVEGSIIYKFPEDASTEYKVWLVFLTVLPFHGLFSLIHYLITLLI